MGSTRAIAKGVRDTVGLITKLFRRGAGDAPPPGTDLLREEGSGPLLRVSRQLLTAGRSDRALTLLRAGILRFPADGDVAELHATAEREEARPQLEGALATLAEEKTAKNHARVSQLYRRLGDDESATEQGRASIAIDARSPFGYRAIARIYLDRFRREANTVDGMNALRYFSKACALDPRHAASLLALAEVFVLLGAPDAARRFLAPVASSHPNDPTVEILERRCAAMPSEETSNVQELFLRHERGGLATEAEESAVAPTEDIALDCNAFVDEIHENIAGTAEVWLLDANRHTVAGRGAEGRTDEEVAALGLLADTVRSCSSRMGVGTFERLVLRADEQLVVIEEVPEGIGAFYFGERPSRQSDVEQTFERLKTTVTTAKGALG